jgi:hypothetical protein
VYYIGKTCLLTQRPLSRRPPRFPPGLARIPIVGQMIRGSKPIMDYWKTHKVTKLSFQRMHGHLRF